jgi:RimJ/RimL family protein N-acetyltransferase
VAVITRSLEPVRLEGRHVVLEPLEARHFDGLKAAANDPALWRYLFIDGHADFQAWWDAATGDPVRMPFAVIRKSDGAVIGSTSYLGHVPLHGRVEIGWTFYAASAQGTAINPEAKLLLLANAFETCGYHRVELNTDANNLRSRAAIKKLGAREDGILRGHMWMPRGYWRDTACHSLLAEEWPAAKAVLEQRLA